MNKLLIICFAALLPLQSFAQPNKWFFSLAPGICIAGPSGPIKNELKAQGFDDVSELNLLGLTITSDYPKKYRNPALLVKAGFRQKENRGYYFVAGIADHGSVEGFKQTGSSSALFPLIGGNSGISVEINYITYQLGAGYEWSNTASGVRFAAAPSLFLFRYTMSGSDQSEKDSKLIPALHGSMRVPLGKERRLFGIDLFLDLNLAPPVKMEEQKATDAGVQRTFRAGSVNMVNAVTGLYYSFRRK